MNSVVFYIQIKKSNVMFNIYIILHAYLLMMKKQNVYVCIWHSLYKLSQISYHFTLISFNSSEYLPKFSSLTPHGKFLEDSWKFTRNFSVAHCHLLDVCSRLAVLLWMLTKVQLIDTC